MSIVKVVELLSNSNKSWEDAVENAVKEASKSIKNIRSVNASNTSATVKDGKIDEYRVNVRITFEIKGK